MRVAYSKELVCKRIIVYMSIHLHDDIKQVGIRRMRVSICPLRRAGSSGYINMAGCWKEATLRVVAILMNIEFNCFKPYPKQNYKYQNMSDRHLTTKQPAGLYSPKLLLQAIVTPIAETRLTMRNDL